MSDTLAQVWRTMLEKTAQRNDQRERAARDAVAAQWFEETIKALPGALRKAANDDLKSFKIGELPAWEIGNKKGDFWPEPCDLGEWSRKLLAYLKKEGLYLFIEASHDLSTSTYKPPFEAVISLEGP